MIVQTDPRRPCVVLVGPPGAGKSTIGRKLAKELGVDLFDTDAGIEAETGRTIPDIFAVDGEPEFRRIEERVVRRAILAERGVVSLGGGAVLSDATRDLLRGRTVVYLEISIAEGLRRTGANNNRPLLAGDDPGEKYRTLMRHRRPLYREVASVRVRTDGRSPGRVVRHIMAKLDLEPVSTTEEPDPETARTPRTRPRRRSRATDSTTPTVSSTETPGPGTPATKRRRRGGRRSRRGAATPTGIEPTDSGETPSATTEFGDTDRRADGTTGSGDTAPRASETGSATSRLGNTAEAGRATSGLGGTTETDRATSGLGSAPEADRTSSGFGSAAETGSATSAAGGTAEYSHATRGLGGTTESGPATSRSTDTGRAAQAGDATHSGRISGSDDGDDERYGSGSAPAQQRRRRPRRRRRSSSSESGDAVAGRLSPESRNSNSGEHSHNPVPDDPVDAARSGVDADGAANSGNAGSRAGRQSSRRGRASAVTAGRSTDDVTSANAVSGNRTRTPQRGNTTGEQTGRRVDTDNGATSQDGGAGGRKTRSQRHSAAAGTTSERQADPGSADASGSGDSTVSAHRDGNARSRRSRSRRLAPAAVLSALAHGSGSQQVADAGDAEGRADSGNSARRSQRRTARRPSGPPTSASTPEPGGVTSNQVVRQDESHEPHGGRTNSPSALAESEPHTHE